jgi:hypothetical protein
MERAAARELLSVTMAYLSRNLFAMASILAAAVVARGQDRVLDQESATVDEIETDRDSFTPAVTTASAGKCQFEASYSFIDNRRAPAGHTFPEMIIRRGITDRLELRLGWNYAIGGPTSAVSNVDMGDEDFVVERSSEMLYGFKFQTSRQSGWLPTSSMLVEGYSPTSGPSNFSRFTIGESLGWTLPNGWQWSSALRFATANDAGDHSNQWTPSTVISRALGRRWNIHAEYFAILSDGKTVAESQHYFSPGGHVHLTKNVELGFRVGFSLNAQTPTFFSNVGLGFRF